jgi:hypothetical protein
MMGVVLFASVYSARTTFHIPDNECVDCRKAVGILHRLIMGFSRKFYRYIAAAATTATAATT